VKRLYPEELVGDSIVVRRFLPHFTYALRALCFCSGLIVLASCNSTSSDTSSTGKKKGSSDPILQKFAGNFDYEKDADGNMRIQSDRRSQFENKSFNLDAKNHDRKEYRVSDFKTDKYRTNDFRGVKDFGYKNAREQGQEVAGLGSFRDAGQRYQGEGNAYKTDTYKTGEFRGSDQTYKTYENSGIKNNRYIQSEPVDNIVQLENRQESFSFRDIKKMVGQ